MKESGEKLLGWLKKNRYVAAVLLFGIVLLMIPWGGDGSGGEEQSAAAAETQDELSFSCDETEERMERLLSSISGAGEVRVMLTLKSGVERVIAVDTESSVETAEGAEVNRDVKETAVIISAGSGVDDAVTLKYIYPEFQGAVIAAEGADSASVRLDITEAVMALTGLDAAKVKVVKLG